jgi:hypothetical protein
LAEANALDLSVAFDPASARKALSAAATIGSGKLSGSRDILFAAAAGISKFRRTLRALIRGWKTYANWIEDARNRARRLVIVDQQIQGTDHVVGRPTLLRWIEAIYEWIFVQNLARADQIAGDETSRTLEEVVGKNSVFSDQWASKMLDGSSNVS